MSTGAQTPAEPASTPDGTPQFTAEEQALIERGQQGFSQPAPAGSEVPPQRPDGVPEKFWKDGKVDTDALLQSYTALESKLGQSQQQQPPADPAATPDGKIEKAKEPEGSPLTPLITTVQTEFAEKGEVSAENIEALTKAGIPQEIVQVYLEGVKALAEQQTSAIYSYVGGPEQYQAMAQWAAQALSDEDLDAYNRALDAPKLRQTAVLGLQARYQQARPSEGALVQPSNTAPNSGDVFASRDELVAAQKDPRYNSDPRYRAEVEAKLLRSQQGGFSMSKPRMFPAVYRK